MCQEICATSAATSTHTRANAPIHTPMQQCTTSTVQMIQMLIIQHMHASVYATQLATQLHKWLGCVNTGIADMRKDIGIAWQDKKRKMCSQFYN